jgi:hypothetical protein
MASSGSLGYASFSQGIGRFPSTGAQGRYAVSLKTLMFSAALTALVLVPSALNAADASIAPAIRQIERGESAACLRWVWQQYSWYDDCWSARHPYIGGRIGVRSVIRR